MLSNLFRHWVSSIINADKIIVIHEGKVVEQGSHNSLLRVNGHYASLWANQTTIRSSAPVITDSFGRSPQKTCQVPSKDVPGHFSLAEESRNLQKNARMDTTRPPWKVRGPSMYPDEEDRSTNITGKGAIAKFNDSQSKENSWKPDAPAFVPSSQLAARSYTAQSPPRHDHENEQSRKKTQPDVKLPGNNINGFSRGSRRSDSQDNTAVESLQPKFMMPKRPRKKQNMRRVFTESEPADIGRNPSPA